MSLPSHGYSCWLESSLYHVIERENTFSGLEEHRNAGNGDGGLLVDSCS
jgi:hypothetical protein